MIQNITLVEVKAAASKAYKENRLLAQSVGPYGYRITCVDGVSRVCAIGAVLSEASLDKIEAADLHTSTISEHGEVFSEIFEFSNDELDDLVAIQDAHDCWLTSVGGHDELNIAQCEAHFVNLVSD